MIKYEHLEGLEFIHGSRDCYELLRDLFRDNWNIELPAIARPDEWWAHGLDLYTDHYRKAGFETIDVHPRDYQVGDVFLMAIKSEVPNHAGVYLGDGMMIHHFYGRRSRAELYKGIWKNTTVMIVRHKDVKIEEEPLDKVDLIDLLPPHLQQRYRNALSQLKTGGTSHG